MKLRKIAFSFCKVKKVETDVADVLASQQTLTNAEDKEHSNTLTHLKIN